MKIKLSPANTIYIIIGVLFLYQLILLGIFVMSHEEISIDILLISAFFLVIGVVIDGVVFYVSRNIQRKLEMDEELKNLYRYREQETALYQKIQLQLNQLREQRHEYANQIQTAYVMIEQGASPEAITKYLENLEVDYKKYVTNK